MSAKTLTGLEKAAVLLQSLPVEVVEKVLRNVNARQAGMVRSELGKIAKRTDLPQILAEVLDEVAAAIVTPPMAPAPKPEPVKATSTPAEKGDLRLAGGVDEKSATNGPLAALAAIPAEFLAQALESETTRTISLLMNCLDIDVAGQIYKRISPAKRKEVSMRFTEQANVSEELLNRISEGVLRKCEAIRAASRTGSAEPGAREQRMAALLRSLERTERMEMIDVLEQTDAELAGRLKTMLYQFEDLLRMQNASVQKLLADIDTKSLALSLSGAAPELSDKIFTNLSKRAQVALKEEIELAGTVPAAKVKQARQAIGDAIQRLDQRGELNMIE